MIQFIDLSGLLTDLVGKVLKRALLVRLPLILLIDNQVELQAAVVDGYMPTYSHQPSVQVGEYKFASTSVQVQWLTGIS